MFGVRQVILFFLLTASPVTFAAPGVFRSTLDFQNSNGNATSLSQEESTNAQGLAQTFELVSPSLYEHWTLDTSIKVSKLDSTLLETKDSKGHDVQWSKEENEMTNVGFAGVSYARGPSTSTFRYGQSLDSSIYQSRSLLLESNLSLNLMTTYVGIQYSKSEMDRPANYVFDNFFGDSSLTWQARPTRLTRSRWTGSVDQMWNENYKTRAELFLQERNQERPRSFGGVFKNSYSLNSYQVARVDLGAASEDRTQSLQDERGYFNMNWLEAAWSQGITYNFWITGSYGFLQEIESDPRNQKKSQVGSDVLGVKAKYLGKGWIGSVRWESIESNSDYKSQNMQGALEWEI